MTYNSFGNEVTCFSDALVPETQFICVNGKHAIDTTGTAYYFGYAGSGAHGSGLLLLGYTITSRPYISKQGIGKMRQRLLKLWKH